MPHDDRKASPDWREWGEGEPMLLVHGALGDRRLWDPHLPRLASAGYRAIAPTLSHHGRAPWPVDGPPFGVRTHADELVAFIESLEAGPVHLVAWSYSAHAALTVAVERPDLLSSLFVYEPGIPTYLRDPVALEAFGQDIQAMFAPVFAAVDRGDLETALVALIDGSAGRDGYFHAQPEAVQTIERDNARTLPLLLRQAPPPPLTPAQLGGIRIPAHVACGELTRPAYRLVSEAAQPWIPGRHRVVHAAGHMWPLDDPAAFCEAVVGFVRAGSGIA